MTPRADVYAFGIVFSEMLTGQHPLAWRVPPNELRAEPATDNLDLPAIRRDHPAVREHGSERTLRVWPRAASGAR